MKQLRAEKGVSQVELARAIGVSNGNVGDWERGRSKPGYDALVALSRYFEISAGRLLGLDDSLENKRDDLTAYKQEQGLTCDGSPLSEEEADLIAMFRLLPSHEREDVFDLVYFKYKKYVEKKMESIYWTYAEGSGDEKSGPSQGLDARDGTA
ncbi:MAG: helix-turn-helix domain-containing protein [Oscillospiraceae bacterium]|nr:helix-turn-helix domain-containing protein [Oscillospiraceae bacterium]